MIRWLSFRTVASTALALLLLTAAPAAGDGLFASPGLGMPAPSLPRTVPPPKTLGMPPLDANQCKLTAGSCPTGRLMRSGNLCYCVSSGGTVRQGTSRTRPQDARPSTTPDP